MSRSTKQAGAMGETASIGTGAKFSEQVENESWLRPVQRAKATEFGAGVIGNQQGVAFNRKRWLRPELIAPQAPDFATAQFLRHHANRTRPLAGNSRSL